MNYSTSIAPAPETNRYRTLLQATMVVLLVGTVFNLVVGLHPACAILTAVGAAGCMMLFYRERFGQAGFPDRVALLTLVSLLFAGLYFFNGGLLGAIPYYLVLINLSSVHLLPRHFLKFFTALQLVCMSLLVGLEHQYPHLVVPYKSELIHRLDISLAVVSAVLFSSWTLWHIEEKASRQHKKVLVAHRQLRTLVTHLEQTHRFTRHDLMGSLSAVEGVLELKESGDFTEGEALDLIVEAVRTAQNLLNNPQLVAAKSVLGDPVEVQFEAVVADAVRRFRPIAQLKEQTISYRSCGCALILGDQILLDSIVNNLLSNAVKYSPRMSSLEVEVSLKGTFVELEVRDNGPGVPRHERGRLFQPYALLSSEPTGGEDSTGLGLFIVHSISLQHGGTAEYFEREREQGSVFRVRLPLRLTNQV